MNDPLEKFARSGDSEFLAELMGCSPVPANEGEESSPAAIDAPPSAATLGITVPHLSHEAAPTRIGPYKLLQVIGEGGMGVVYLAEQDKPVRRKVALKIIKPGMDSAGVIARFEAERQALAMMDHANIARVYDADATADGQPYFVMELVQGIPITQYCDEKRLTPRQRLELFIPVCQAVQHAHQKGIIHRDLKPSNILVTQSDGKPVPKVIDFGVARALHQKLTEKTIFTHFGQVVGTLEYMSPEQTEPDILGADTRADIYSLGALLYELLTGSTPLDGNKLRQAGYEAVLKTIREEEPQKPSTRLISQGAALSSLSAQRQTEPKKLTKLVTGDLDWIIMKCLEKERSRRYETANALARDIERFLSDEPVEASPPSATYKLRKFARKHRAALLVMTTFMLLLIAATGVSSWLAALANRAKEDAKVDREKALIAKSAAEQSEADTRAFSDFLVQDVLSAPRPRGRAGGLGNSVTVRQALDRSAPSVAQRFADRPKAEARVRYALGRTYFDLAAFPEALRETQRAVELYQLNLGPLNRQTLAAMTQLATIYNDTGDYSKAISILEETIKQQKSLPGADDSDTLVTMNELAIAHDRDGSWDVALSLFEQTLALHTAKYGADNLETLLVADNVASFYLRSDRLLEGQRLIERTLATIESKKFARNHPVVLSALNNLATAYMLCDRPKDAIRLFEELRPLQEAAMGRDHPDCLLTMTNLARAFEFDGQPEKAVPLCDEALRLANPKLGANDPTTLLIMNNLACAYTEAGYLQKALPLFEEVLSDRKTKPGPAHPDTLLTMGNLGNAYIAAEQFDNALPMLEQAVASQTAKLGPEHRSTLNSKNSLGVAYIRRKEPEKALPLFEEVFKVRKIKLGINHRDTLAVANDLAAAYRNLRRFPEALALYQETLKLQQEKFGPDREETLRTMKNFAVLYGSLREYAKAEPLSEHVLEIWRKRLRPDNHKVIDALLDLSTVYQLLGKFEKAEPLMLTGFKAMQEAGGASPVDREEFLREIIFLYDRWPTPNEGAKRLDDWLAASGQRERVAAIRAKFGFAKPAPAAPTTPIAPAKIIPNESPKDAEPRLRKLVEENRRTLGDDHPDTIKALNDHATTLMAIDRADEAVSLLSEALRRAQASAELGPDHAQTRLYATNYAACLDAINSREEAAAIRAKFGLQTPPK